MQPISFQFTLLKKSGRFESLRHTHTHTHTRTHAHVDTCKKFCCSLLCKPFPILAMEHNAH